MQFGDEGVTTTQLENGSLVFDDIHFLVLNYELFVYDFHGEKLTVASA